MAVRISGKMITGRWWTFVLRGLMAILFGILSFLMPGMALLTLVFLFGIYAISEGIVNLIGAFRRRGGEKHWGSLLLGGLVSVISGVLALVFPGITALALLYLIAGWAVATGILQIVAALRLRRQITGEWLLGTAGILSILFGVLLMLFPGPGALAVVLWIAAYAIVFGAMLIALGLKLRRIRRGVEPEANWREWLATGR